MGAARTTTTVRRRRAVPWVVLGVWLAALVLAGPPPGSSPASSRTGPSTIYPPAPTPPEWPGSRPGFRAVSLSDLVETARLAGARVEQTIRVRQAPPAVGAAAYRIVQEALTNAVRHAGPEPAVHVGLHEEQGALRLSVTDDGTGPTPGDTPGFGLVEDPRQQDPGQARSPGPGAAGHGRLRVRSGDSGNHGRVTLLSTALLSPVLLVTLALLTPHATATRTSAATGCTSSVPYVSGEGGYDTYRIPATVTTRRGTVLAFAEGRYDGAADSGHIDVVLRRSQDGGCTWGPSRVVAAGDGNTRGNPAPVVDPRTGAIVLVTSCNSGAVTEAQIMRGEVTPERGRRVFVQHSLDDGRHFTAPRDITAQVKRPEWRWYATGPGHALALTHGPHAGRLVVPADHSAAPPAGSSDTGQEAKYYGGHAIYSDDGGQSWHIGFVDGSHDGEDNANESTAAELPDGRLYFGARDQNGTSAGNRLDTYSGDGGRTLERPYAVQPTLDDVPVVEGSVLQLPGPDGPLLFSGPSVPNARRSMAIWRSTDAGETFTKALTLSTRKAAYSDLTQVDGDTVGVLYETGDSGTYDTIEFRRLPIDGLPDGLPDDI